jgi:hypothetical protein
MPPRAWAAIGVGLIAADAYCAYVKHDGTLSHAIREALDTNTRDGRIRLVAIWAAGSAWLLPHLAIWPADRLIKEIS